MNLMDHTDIAWAKVRQMYLASEEQRNRKAGDDLVVIQHQRQVLLEGSGLVEQVGLHHLQLTGPELEQHSWCRRFQIRLRQRRLQGYDDIALEADGIVIALVERQPGDTLVP